MISNREFAKETINFVSTLKRRPVNFLSLSMSEQSEYADPITKKYATNEKFIIEQLNNINMSDLYKNASRLNETSIANIAYLAIHSDYKEDCEKLYHIILREYTDYNNKNVCILQ